MLAHKPQFKQIMEDADRRIQETGGIKHDEFWQPVDRISAESA